MLVGLDKEVRFTTLVGKFGTYEIGIGTKLETFKWSLQGSWSGYRYDDKRIELTFCDRGPLPTIIMEDIIIKHLSQVASLTIDEISIHFDMNSIYENGVRKRSHVVYVSGKGIHSFIDHSVTPFNISFVADRSLCEMVHDLIEENVGIPKKRFPEVA